MKVNVGEKQKEKGNRKKKYGKQMMKENLWKKHKEQEILKIKKERRKKIIIKNKYILV